MESYLIAILVLSAIGILNTLYLTYHKFAGTPVKCLFFPDEWCKKVQYSKYSKTLGIPNSIAGLVMYTAILILTLMFANGAVSFAPITGLVIFGFAFSMYFTFIQAFVLRAFCTWCVLSAIEFTLLLIIVTTWR